ncbi:hypothetical protein GE115_03520 [Agromyces sp. CFH 90414]|uniref:Uncharacterized protein n=1 Tax=Agromyces agglutinans TaxID=2662258 RepID=A0A6I2F324_9MICO|nr:hypothetical protein [Agromyces agglutinans]MRG58942.1 hypothetical protein [Agromyces agglutinans]
MNTTLTALSSAGSTDQVRRRARLARERLAIRMGLALVAWGRRQDARLTHEAVAQSRRNAAIGSSLRDGAFAGVTISTRASL